MRLSGQDHPSPDARAEARPCHVGQRDGLQAEGQVYNFLLNPTPSLTAAPQPPPEGLPGVTWPSLPPKAYLLLNTVVIYENSVGHHPKREGKQEQIPPRTTQSRPLPLCYRHMGLGTHRCHEKQPTNVHTARNTLLQDARHMSVREV